MTHRVGWAGDKRNGVCDVANWVPPGVRQPLTVLPSSFLSSCAALQWRTEILDYCPSTRVLLIGCKTDLRTDLSTLMELSHQKQAPISYEQVGVCVCARGPMCGLGVELGKATGEGLGNGSCSHSFTIARENWYSGVPSVISKLVTWMEVMDTNLLRFILPRWC